MEWRKPIILTDADNMYLQAYKFMKTFKVGWNEVLNTPYHIVDFMNRIELAFGEKIKDDFDRQQMQSKF